MCFSGSNPIFHCLVQVKAMKQFHSRMIQFNVIRTPRRMLKIGGGFHLEIAPNLAHSFTWSCFATEFQLAAVRERGEFE